jgi:catechol 2,3-dioxygenase-like lactoylglutathione lyase family enzyme
MNMSGPTPTSLEPELPSLYPAFPHTTRRLFLQTCGALAAAPWATRAVAATAAAPLPLPLHLSQLVNHIGISVPDVTKSATFYSHLFDGSRISGQEKPSLRYIINFYPGAMSVGDLRGAAGGAQRQPLIDHFCVAAEPYDQAAWRARLEQEGIRYFAGGSFIDIDSIPVQLVGGRSSATPRRPPAGGGGGFMPMPPLFAGQPLVKAHGFEHVMLHVSDLDAATAAFRKLFGLVPHTSGASEVFFSVGAVRLGLRKAADGEKPSIASYAIKVAKFDRSRVSDGLEVLGAMVERGGKRERRTVLRFADPDGINCELWAV